MNWNWYKLMDDSPEPTGENGGGATTSSASGAEGGKEALGETSSTETNNVSSPEGNAPTPSSEGEAKPFLGEGSSSEAKPAPATEEEYLKALVKDEKLLGTDAKVTLDSALAKSVVPLAQELGIAPDALNKMANALAKAQLDQAKEYTKSRIDYFNKMKEESVRKYTPKDFEVINKAIDANFKVGGVMNQVIRNSELGADPEFLALLFKLGQSGKVDGIAGAGSGSNGVAADPNSIDGLAKMW